MLNKNRTFPKVLINVNGDQDDISKDQRVPPSQRDSGLTGAQKRAVDAVKEVKRWGEDVTISALNDEEVQQIYNVLQEDSEIELINDSNSDGREKKLTIKLKTGDS